MSGCPSAVGWRTHGWKVQGWSLGLKSPESKCSEIWETYSFPSTASTGFWWLAASMASTASVASMSSTAFVASMASTASISMSGWASVSKIESETSTSIWLVGHLEKGKWKDKERKKKYA